MVLFRLLLGVIFVALLGYTAVTISNHGVNLLPVFFGDMAKMAWPGQFNFDFMGFLVLSGLWVMWRHDFKAGGIALGVLAFFGGILFLSLYLLIQSFKTDADMPALLLGSRRAKALAKPH